MEKPILDFASLYPSQNGGISKYMVSVRIYKINKILKNINESRNN